MMRYDLFTRIGNLIPQGDVVARSGLESSTNYRHQGNCPGIVGRYKLGGRISRYLSLASSGRSKYAATHLIFNWQKRLHLFNNRIRLFPLDAKK
jgi:hypothetical protein